MKRLIVSLTIAAFTVAGAMAQDTGEGVMLLNYNTVKKKAEKSDAEIQDPKKNIKSATWFKRGEIYQDVFELGLEQTTEGMPAATLELFYKKANSVESETKEDGSLHEKYIYDHMTYTFVNGLLQEWERIDPISEDPLVVAMEAYIKSLELDDKGKLGDKVKENLNNLKNQMKRQGVNSYYKGNYDAALGSFENVLSVNQHKLFAGEFDTVMVQYSGIISREIAEKKDDKELYEKAIGYYKQLTEAGFGGHNTYLQIKMDYMAIGDTAQAIEILKEAYEKYPDTVNVIANVADTYIQTKAYEEGLAFMEKVLERSPDIAEAYYWNGRLLINMEDVEYIDQAIESYKKVTELDPSIYYSWYDLGYIYYLQGQDFYERSNAEENGDIRDELIKLGKEKNELAIPVLEKAYELNEENSAVKFETLDLLQRIYYKEQMMDEYERVKGIKASM